MLLVWAAVKRCPWAFLRFPIAAIDREPSRISARPIAQRLPAPQPTSPGRSFVGLRDARANGTRAETTSQKMRRRLALYALLLAPAAAALRRGDAAPAFVGENYDGQQVTLASATGPKGLVLWFYPKAGTGG